VGAPARLPDGNEKTACFSAHTRHFGRAPVFLAANPQCLMLPTGDTELFTRQMVRFVTPLAFCYFRV